MIRSRSNDPRSVAAARPARKMSKRCISMQPDAEGFLSGSGCKPLHRVRLMREGMSGAAPLRRTRTGFWRGTMPVATGMNRCGWPARRAECFRCWPRCSTKAVSCSAPGSTMIFQWYTIVLKIAGLGTLRGSKYTQSRIEGQFRRAESLLKAGREVLFVGTSCQIAGLKRFPRSPYANLLAVDVLRHGVPRRVYAQYFAQQTRRVNAEAQPATGNPTGLRTWNFGTRRSAAGDVIASCRNMSVRTEASHSNCDWRYPSPMRCSCAVCITLPSAVLSRMSGAPVGGRERFDHCRLLGSGGASSGDE